MSDALQRLVNSIERLSLGTSDQLSPEERTLQVLFQSLLEKISDINRFVTNNHKGIRYPHSDLLSRLRDLKTRTRSIKHAIHEGQELKEAISSTDEDAIFKKVAEELERRRKTKGSSSDIV